MMKLVVLVAFVAVATADVSHLLRGHTQHRAPVPVAPRAISAGQPIAILRLESDITPEGSYQYAYETENGISGQEQASVKVLGPEQVAKNAQGSFSWTSPEGQPIAISYVADENGYQPAGDALPTPPPIPVAIAKALEWIRTHPSQETVKVDTRYKQF